LHLPQEDRERIAQAPQDRRAALGILGAAFLFNLGQGVLRPSLPLYLRHVFAANYRMVTLIPAVFAAGKWAANLPTGYLLDRLGRRPLTVAGLLLIAACDLASVAIVEYSAFLAVRACAGMGWAMFATVATTAMVNRAEARGHAISLLLMSETLGLLVGSTVGGWLYEHSGRASPFIFEAGCMVIAGAVVGSAGMPAATQVTVNPFTTGRLGFRTLLHVPGFVLMCSTNAAIVGIQSGVIVFLLPLYLVERGQVSPEVVGSLIALSVLGRLLGIWVAGGVSERDTRISALALGLLGFGAVLGTFTLVSHPALFAAWSLVIGATGGFIAGLPTTIIGDRVDASLQGIAIGWLRTATDAGMLLGPLVMGPLADRFDLTIPFIAAAAIASALTWACRRHAVRTS
jgi:MFS family permease